MIRAIAMRHCGGQALAEAVLALYALGMLLLALAAVGRLQDMALHTGFAGRAVSFFVAQRAHEVLGEEGMAAYFFRDAERRWRNHDASPLLPAAGVRVQVGPAAAGSLPTAGRVGGDNAQAGMLRPEFLPDALPDARDLIQGRVAVAPRLARAGAALSPPAGWFDGWLDMRPLLSTRFATLAHAGHARDDADAQQRIASAERAWRAAAGATERAGRSVAALGRVDAPWHRPPPGFDWLMPWEALVPADVLEPRP